MVSLPLGPGRLDSERDIEIAAVVDLMQRVLPHSVLDVGAHWSGYYYAPQVRDYCAWYEGIDILEIDPLTSRYLDLVHQCSVLDIDSDEKFDVVLCISAIEHSGISTYRRDDYAFEQDRVFEKILSLTADRALLTFPFGVEFLYPGQYANITEEVLGRWETQCYVRTRFFYYAGAHRQSPFEEVNREFASRVQYDSTRGNQCVAIVECDVRRPSAGRIQP
jgi:hypothetical protein